jgi:hypothetical protein
MAGTDIYLGPPGLPVKLPPPVPGIELPLERPTAVQELGSGAKWVDRFGRGRRRYSLSWEQLTVDELTTIERLAMLPGPLILDMPDRRNRLTANQSNGGDVLRTDEGVLARFQGVEGVSTAQFRSAPRSFSWDTTGALGSTNRGLYFYSSSTVVDDTWHSVRVGAFYAATAWLRSTVAVNMYAGFDWMDAAGAYISTSAFGTAVGITTTGFSQVTRTGVAAVANAAYGIPFWINSATTGSTLVVYVDDAMVEEVSAAGVSPSAHVVGTGMPRVSVIETPASSRLLGYTSPTLVLQEL